MYRPNPAQLAELLCGTRLLDGTILGTGVSYRNAVRKRPWLLLRHLWRLPIPFVSFEKWQRSMARLYWLAAEYRITCAVFEVDAGSDVASTQPTGRSRGLNTRRQQAAR